MTNQLFPPDPIREHLERSREHVRNVTYHISKDAGNAYRAGLWKALEAITNGDWLLARERIRGLLVEYAEKIEREPAAFLAAAIYCLQFDVARALVAKLYPELGDASFAPCRNGDRFCMQFPGVTLWEITGKSRSTFNLGPQFWDIGCHLALERLMVYLPALAAFMKSTLRESGYLHINTADHGFGPGITSSAPWGQFFLVPDPDYIGSRGYAETAATFQANYVPFSQRRPAAFWRGGSQGHSTTGWTGVPRVRMCKLAVESSRRDLMDFKIVYIVNSSALPPEESDLLQNSGLMGEFVPFVRILEYKYQIDIDGHTNAWGALFQKLLSGSPVIKVASPAGYRQWYYDRLEPWINYVPAAPDLSDLEDKIVWLTKNDAAAEMIGRRGRELALSLDYTSQLAIMHRTIDEAMDALAADD